MKDIEQKMTRLAISSGLVEQVSLVKNMFTASFAAIADEQKRTPESIDGRRMLNMAMYTLFNIEESKEDKARERAVLRILQSGGALSDYLFSGIAMTHLLIGSSMATNDGERHIDDLNRLREIMFRITDSAAS